MCVCVWCVCMCVFVCMCERQWTLVALTCTVADSPASSHGDLFRLKLTHCCTIFDFLTDDAQDYASEKQVASVGVCKCVCARSGACFFTFFSRRASQPFSWSSMRLSRAVSEFCSLVLRFLFADDLLLRVVSRRRRCAVSGRGVFVDDDYFAMVGVTTI